MTPKLKIRCPTSRHATSATPSFHQPGFLNGSRQAGHSDCLPPLPALRCFCKPHPCSFERSPTPAMSGADAVDAHPNDNSTPPPASITIPGPAGHESVFVHPSSYLRPRSHARPTTPSDTTPLDVEQTEGLVSCPPTNPATSSPSGPYRSLAYPWGLAERFMD